MKMLRIGERGQDVSDLQEMLNLKIPLEPLLKVDGIFGPKTQGRVLSFQRDQRLAADGIVGPLTGKALVAAVLAATLKPGLPR